MNKEWKQEDLDKFLETDKEFKEKCKNIVKIIYDLNEEIGDIVRPYCFDDFHINEDGDVVFSIYTSTGERLYRSFPQRLLTIKWNVELRHEILKEMGKQLFENGTDAELIYILKADAKYESRNPFKCNKEEYKTLEVVNEKNDIGDLEYSITMKGLNSTVTKEMLDKPYDCCTDGRFEMIERVKNYLKEATNIETDEDEMKVIDNILFRFWQMGWLDMIDEKIKEK